MTNAYHDKRGKNHDILLTQNLRIGRDSKRNLANLNVIVLGGPGSGKTFTFVKPNLLQTNCSYIITDPKGEILRDIAPVLQAKGIPFTVLNFTDKALSDCYNPLAYINEDADVPKLVANLMKNTTPKDSKSSDPFWDQSATALLTAFILYLKYTARPEEQTFNMVCKMISNAAASEDENKKSGIDVLFEQLDQNSLPAQYYSIFKQAAGVI